MRRELDFHFSLLSTYTYLAVNRAEEVAARSGVTLRWRPFNVRAIMREQNNSPFLGKPVKTKYMWRDLERRARQHGIPFKSIPTYPVDPEMLANRIAFLAAEEGWCPAYAKETYRDWFLENKPPGDIPNTRAILSRLGKDPDRVIAEADGESIRQRFDAETQRVKELGIFGSPTFACGSELFWGDDRLEEAIAWCVGGGAEGGGPRQVMEGLFAALSQGDAGPFVEALADDVRWEVTGTSRWSRAYDGKRAVMKDFLGPVMENFGTRYRNSPRRMTVEGDRVVVECRGEVTTKGGKPYNNEYCWVFRLEGGRIKEVTEYMCTKLAESVLA